MPMLIMLQAVEYRNMQKGVSSPHSRREMNLVRCMLSRQSLQEPGVNYRSPAGAQGSLQGAPAAAPAEGGQCRSLPALVLAGYRVEHLIPGTAALWPPSKRQHDWLFPGAVACHGQLHQPRCIPGALPHCSPQGID